MALSLRELLDKQRADREAKERGGGGATPVSPVAAIEQPTKPEPPPISHSENVGNPKPTPAPIKRSMFSSLAGVPANVTQSQTPSPAPSPVPETPVQRTTGASEAANGTATASASLPGPALTDDETENLRRNLAFLAANLDEKEVIGQVLRTTVRQIQQHPELNAIMIDSDFDLIVQAARRSMKFTARKKEDKANVKASKADKKAELDKWLKDSGIDIDGL